VDDANVYQLPSYWRYDAMAAYQFNKNFGLQLNLNNLTDETIYEASHVGLFSYVAPGRSAMLTATFRYN
jgi:catecholate siderophore receptor